MDYMLGGAMGSKIEEPGCQDYRIVKGAEENSARFIVGINLLDNLKDFPG
jgi:hypothetical protein